MALRHYFTSVNIKKFSRLLHLCGDWLTVTHSPQNIRFIRAEAKPEHSPRNQDNSAQSCSSMFSNKDGDKEAKLMDCSFTFTFTFMHLADAFIQSDLHCIQVTVFTFHQLSAFHRHFNPKQQCIQGNCIKFHGNRSHNIALLFKILCGCFTWTS